MARPHDEQSAAVITRYVEHTFPYRHLVSGPGFGPRRDQMLDAIAGLLVELHLSGCFWGDCSLSNLLYRYDAEAIESIMIDAGVSSLRQVSDGQRAEDLEIMKMNLAGEMADIAAMTGLEIDRADFTLGEDVEARYRSLWDELTEELVITREESYRIRTDRPSQPTRVFGQRCRPHPDRRGKSGQDEDRGGRPNFSFRASPPADRHRRLREPGPGHPQRFELLPREARFGPASGKSVGTFKWLTTSFEPMVARISELRPGNPVQGYCDLLHHRFRLAQRREQDVANEEALEDWVAAGTPGFDLAELPV